MPASDLLKQGVIALKAGRRVEARKLLAEVVRQDKNNETAWLWLSGAVDTNEERRICLERVLAINPNNDMAKRGLESILAKEGLLLIETLSQATPESESTETPQRHPIQHPSKVGRPSVGQRSPTSKPRKASKRQTDLIVGFVAVGIVAVVGISLAGIWWAINNSLLEVAPSASIPTATPVPTETSIPTWTPTSTPDARARVEGYLAEFCLLWKDKFAILAEGRQFWSDLDAYRLIDDPDYHSQIVAQHENLTLRSQNCNDKLRELSPPSMLLEHHRLLVRALDYEDLSMEHASEFLHKLDTVLMEQSLEEYDACKEYLERSLDELDRVTTNLGFEHPCPSLSEEISIPATPTAQAPTSTPLVLPTLTPVPQFVGTEAEFKAYLRSRYSSIAGNQLQIEDIYILVEEDTTFPVRAVTIELTSDSAVYVFLEQTRADALEYGTNLLHDVMAYFGGQDCIVSVSDIYYTHELKDYHFDEEWYYIGDYDIDDGWYIRRDYVKAHFIGGVEKVEVWNWR